MTTRTDPSAENARVSLGAEDLEVPARDPGRHARTVIVDRPRAPGSTPSVLRIVLADDHAVVRAGIRMLVERVPGWEVVAECGDADTAARQVGEHRPDVLVLDLTMPGRPSLDVVPELRRSAPDTRVVILTMEAEPALARMALAAGAAAYVLKDAADTELVEAIRRVAAGGSYLDPALGALVAAAPPSAASHSLSDREVEVLRLIALGNTNTEIAEALRLSVRTVETHRSHLVRKTGSKTRAQLVTYALGAGLLDELFRTRPHPVTH
jgi:two-component system, NarL family, response regulator NreC